MTVQNDMEALFPELALINDRNLREQCAAVWEEVLDSNGWSEETVRLCPVAPASLRDDCPECCLDHCRRVTRLCAVLYDELSDLFRLTGMCDRDDLLAAAVLHDVGKFAECQPKNGSVHKCSRAKYFKHPVVGAYYAEKHGLPWKVVHAILAHSDGLSPQGQRASMTPESLLLKKADYICYDYLALFYKREEQL